MGKHPESLAASVAQSSSVIDTLRRHASAGSSGELIVATDALEIHLYLLDGRLAWGTASSAPQTFVHRLVDEHGVDEGAVRDVIAECQRSRRRLGETLVAWGVATPEQVRDALGAQITTALEAVAAHPHAPSLFLPRRMSYAREYTFALDDLLGAAPTGAPSEFAEQVVATLLDSIHEILWVDVTVGGVSVARVARGAGRPTDDLAPLRAALRPGAIEALVVRSTYGVVFAQRAPGTDTIVCCAASPDVKVGVAALVLAGAVGLAPATDRTAAAATGPIREQFASPAAGAILLGAVRTSDDVTAALLFDKHGAVTAAWRGDDQPGAHVALARELGSTLTLPLRQVLARSPDPAHPEPPSVRAHGDALAYHGIALPRLGGSLWLALRASASQGLGWALVQALARQCNDALGADA